jgi:hypothetical protein
MRLIRRGIITALTQRSSNQIGTAGEMWLKLELVRSGYCVSYMPRGEVSGDLKAIDSISGEVFLIEVKTARKCQDGKWRFTLEKSGPFGSTSHAKVDIVALLAVTESGRVIPFIVPVSEVSTQRQAVISSHPERYQGRLAKWRRHYDHHDSRLQL